MAFLLAFAFGSCLSSFFNLYLERRERGEDWIFKRSHCACNRPIQAFYLTPIIGYFFAKGRCACGRAISPAHPITEVYGGLIFLMATYTLFHSSWGVSFVPLISLYLLLALEDILFKEVYARELILLVFLTAMVALLNHRFYPLSGLMIFALLFAIHHLVPTGFGEGDIYYGALLAMTLPGLWISYLFFTCSFVLGAIGGGLILKGNLRCDRRVPMYPFFLLSYSLAGVYLSW